MMGCRGADLVQRDDQEQFPDLLAVGDVVMPLREPSEEGAEDRLDDLLGGDFPRQVGRSLPRRQGSKAIGIAQVELGRRILLPAPESTDQRAIRGGFLGTVLAWPLV